MQKRKEDDKCRERKAKRSININIRQNKIKNKIKFYCRYFYYILFYTHCRTRPTIQKRFICDFVKLMCSWSSFNELSQVNLKNPDF